VPFSLELIFTLGHGENLRKRKFGCLTNSFPGLSPSIVGRPPVPKAPRL
jgi:hypothetical protein